MTIDDHAAACHSIVLRLPAGSDLPELPVEVWRTSVPAGPDEPAAVARRRAESLRPVHPDRPPLRAVALSYADGTVDLVLVAVRSAVPPNALRLPLTEVGEPRPGVVSRARPDWGLGDPALSGTVGRARIDAPAELLLPAVALAVARYGGTTLGVLEDEQLRVYAVDEPSSTADLVGRFEQPPAAAPEPPPVGVIVGPAAGAGTYTACLAPVFPLTVQLPDGTCSYDQGAVDPAIAEEFCAQVAHLAAQLADRSPSEVDLMPPVPAPPVAPVRGRIDRAVEEVAARQPDAVAVVAGDQQLTYRELDRRADAVAAGLAGLGVTPGGRVGVCLDRDADLVVTLLGVLKAGCAYVPMDPHYPAQRLRFTAQDAELPVVVTTAPEFPAIPGVRLVSPSDLAGDGAERPRAGSDDDPAYVIYTSGSTGTPKGVVVPHRNVLALLRATAGDFGLGPDDTWTLFHSSAFDFSVWEIWGCLLTGGRLVVVPYWTTRDTEEFHALLAERRVTVLNQTPSAFAQLVATDQRAGRDLALRLVIFGGEPLDVRMLAPWFARHPAGDCRVVNMFGITETTVHVTAQTVTPREVVAGSRSVGRPLPGWSVSVRDERGRVLPPGPAGEIYVGGLGVASHYLGRPDLTEQRFLRDEATGERVYRSGDKGRLRPDGRLDHLGRLDNQVKVRGHRIELDEIRTVLLGAPGVTAAAVVVNQERPDDPASSRIDAYVVVEGPSSVLGHARATLPDYMVPATVTEVAEIPLTINGKLDVSRLPAPRTEAAPASGGRTEAPPASGGLTEDVLGIWSSLLNTPVSPEDNFFTLGGNSLLVVRALAAMRERGLPKVSPKQFYGASTAKEFVELVRGLSDDQR